MTSALRWTHAEPGVREAVDAWWKIRVGEHAGHTMLHRGTYRTVIRLDDDAGTKLVKHYLPGTGLRGQRNRIELLLGFSAAHREWRGIERLSRSGIPAPRALGLAHSTEGDALLVSGWIPGQTLWDRLAARTPEQRSLLESVAGLVALLHRAGLAHGDLHPGNILIGTDGPILLDLQRCARARSGGSRQTDDLALLDYSLRQLDVSRTERLLVLTRALCLEGATRAARRRALVRAIRASERISARQTRTRAHHGRAPAIDSGWMR